MENEIMDETLASIAKPPAEEPSLGEVQEAEPEQTPEGEPGGEPIDYAKMAEEDLLAVRELCPELAALESLSELPSAERFGELRELGLSVLEALGALGLTGAKHDTRSHLRASVPRRLGDAGVRMTPSELESARRLFPRLSEREITRLYRRVNQ